MQFTADTWQDATAVLREMPHRRHDLLPGLRARQGHHRPGQRRDRQPPQWRATAIDAGRAGADARPLRHTVVDVRLQRVLRIEVGLQGPVVAHTGAQHRCMLARAVHQHTFGPATRGQVRNPGLLPVGQVRGAEQVAFTQTAPGQDVAYPCHMERLSRVGRRRQRDVRTVQVQPRLQHGRRL